MSMSNTTIRVEGIRRNTRRKFSSEEKIRILVLDARPPALKASVAANLSPRRNATGRAVNQRHYLSDLFATN